MVKLNINISNRTFILFGIFLIIIIVCGIVVAYNSNPASPAVFGHSASEIEGLPSTTSLLVRHSLSSTVPSCPSGWNSVYNGYSFLAGTGTGGYSGVQDLGSTGSCLPRFSFIPFAECPNGISGSTVSYGQCDHVTAGDYAYWLTASTDNTNGRTITSSSGIGRCTVCEKQAAPVLVLHSLSSTVPTCPSGWNPTPLWTGYSLEVTSGGSGVSGPQSLGSTGSCLEQVIAIPFVECSYVDAASPKMACDHVTNYDYAYWLIADDNSDTLTSIPTGISRCAVCTK